MKINKQKVLSFAGIIAASVVSTLLSNMMQEKEIQKAVDDHFAIENKEEEA